MRVLTTAENESMVERLLRGERGDEIAQSIGVSATLPALRAQRWGFTLQRLNVVRPEDITERGRQWLAGRPYYRVNTGVARA